MSAEEHQRNIKFQIKIITTDFVRQTPKLGPRPVESSPWRRMKIKHSYEDSCETKGKADKSSHNNSRITPSNKLWKEKKEQQDKI